MNTTELKEELDNKMVEALKDIVPVNWERARTDAPVPLRGDALHAYIRTLPSILNGGFTTTKTAEGNVIRHHKAVSIQGDTLHLDGDQPVTISSILIGSAKLETDGSADLEVVLPHNEGMLHFEFPARSIIGNPQ